MSQARRAASQWAMTAGRRRGSRRRPEIARPKGRALDHDCAPPGAVLLARGCRDGAIFLIEALHRLQDGIGHLAAPDLRALAEEFSIPQPGSLRGCEFLPPFRYREGRRDPAAGADHPRLRQCRLHDCRRRGARSPRLKPASMARRSASSACPVSGAAPRRPPCMSAPAPSRPRRRAACARRSKRMISASLRRTTACGLIALSRRRRAMPCWRPVSQGKRRRKR